MSFKSSVQLGNISATPPSDPTSPTAPEELETYHQIYQQYQEPEHDPSQKQYYHDKYLEADRFCAPQRKRKPSQKMKLGAPLPQTPKHPAPSSGARKPHYADHQQQFITAPTVLRKLETLPYQEQPYVAPEVTVDLPPDVLASYKKKFDALDLNGDGMITPREFATVGMVLGYRFSLGEMKEIFGRRDLDMSGTITFSEFAIALKQRSERNRRLLPLKKKFAEFDVRGRGYITTDEAYPILRRDLGFDMNKTETMIDQYDKNKDYRLSLFEFEHFYQKYEQLKVEMHRAFKSFDIDSDGYIDQNELREGLLPRGFNESQISMILREYDIDRDDKLSYPEFVAFWDLPIF